MPAKLKRKDLNLTLDTELLSLHPTDSSKNEENMSVASDSIVVDTFI